MIRHLHDLSALSTIIDREKELFVSTTALSFDVDQQSNRRNTQEGLHESMRRACSTLKSDHLYEQEYSHFVDAMSYANEADIINFTAALANFENLIALFEP